MLPTTSLAPPFTLPDQNGTLVSLAGLRGRWVVLYFYPRDDTPGCTIEACEFTAALPQFEGLDAQVFGCSADDASSHQKFIAKHNLGIGLLTDASKDVMKSYGAYGMKQLYGKDVEGVIRSTVIIAPDSRIAYHWPIVRAEGHAEQVRARLAELQGGAPTPATMLEAAVTKAAAPAPKPAAKKPVAKKAAKKAPAKKAAKKAKKKPAAKKTAKKTAKKGAKKTAKKKAKKSKR